MGVTGKSMKKIVLIGLASAFFCGCASNKALGGVTYEPYGLLNQATVKSDKVLYEVEPITLIVAVIFCETIIIPLYIIGYDLYSPVKLVEVKK